MNTAMLEKQPDTGNGIRKWWWIVAAVTVLVLAGAATALALTRHGGGTTPTPPPAVSQAAPAQSAPAGTTAAVSPPPVSVPAGTSSAAPNLPAFRFMPLWPFNTVADAVSWQRDANPGGHQPWHLRPETTAVVFVQTYLGFGGMDRDLGTTQHGDEAWVKVGYRADNGTDVTAAVLHLAQLGAGEHQPWEVVGSQDSTLTLTTPVYGSRVGSPVTTGGRITGIDESLRIQVLGLGGANPLGETTGVSAGGQNARWSATVSFRQSAGTVRTIVVATTSQLDGTVTQFALTGVRVG